MVSVNMSEDRSREVLVKVLRDFEIGKVGMMFLWFTHDHEHDRDFLKILGYTFDVMIK